MDNATRGRADLLNWEASKPDNYFAADRNLQYVLQKYMGDSYEAFADHLDGVGAEMATTMDENCRAEDRLGNHPRLQRWSHLGERIEEIEFHPNHDANGRLVWGSGLLKLHSEAAVNVKQVALLYLISHNGEGGHMCSVVCTMGAIRAMQAVGSDDIKAKFLSKLISDDYETKHHAAQFLTEVQGGSDVGANAVRAVENDDGTYRIYGEKWFCSNINSDQFVMTARPEDAPDGTRGLGMFLVPRLLDDGATNHFYIRRLKDKLGTRTLASAELDFDGAIAYPIGDVSQGFKNVVELVLNTSRLLNAVGCVGIIRRALIEASTYACNRQAFGTEIANYPLVQEAIADLHATSYAALSSTFMIAHMLDQLERGEEDSQDFKYAYRMLVNINKYVTSIQGTDMVHRAIEILGGNGAIESFSVLPRLYRDMIVYESWEGTHNTLAAQVWRDMQKYQIHEPYLAYCEAHLNDVGDGNLQDDVATVNEAIARLTQMIDRMATADTAYQQLHMRRMVDALSFIGQATFMLSEADWELSKGFATDKPDAIRHFVNNHLVANYDPLGDEDYLARLKRTTTAVLGL